MDMYVHASKMHDLVSYMKICAQGLLRLKAMLIVLLLILVALIKLNLDTNTVIKDVPNLGWAITFAIQSVIY